MFTRRLVIGPVLIFLWGNSYCFGNNSSSIVKNGQSFEGKTIGNTAGLKMPLEIKMKIPGNDWLYEGTYGIEGGGRPGGNMVQKATLHLTIPRSSNWPVTVTGIENNLQAWTENPKTHKLVETDPKMLAKEIPFPPMLMEQSGRFSRATYYFGGDPTAFLNELWPLPLKKLNIGETFREKVDFKNSLKYPYGVMTTRAVGVREIKLLGTKTIDGFPCALVQIKADLQVSFTPEEMGPYKMTVLSDLVFDVSNGIPLSVKQGVKIKAKGMEDGKPTDVNLTETWDLKRINLSKSHKD